MTPVLSALLEGLVWSALWVAMLMPMFFRFPWLLVHDFPNPPPRSAGTEFFLPCSGM